MSTELIAEDLRRRTPQNLLARVRECWPRAGHVAAHRVEIGVVLHDAINDRRLADNASNVGHLCARRWAQEAYDRLSDIVDEWRARTVTAVAAVAMGKSSQDATLADDLMWLRQRAPEAEASLEDCGLMPKIPHREEAHQLAAQIAADRIGELAGAIHPSARPSRHQYDSSGGPIEVYWNCGPPSARQSWISSLGGRLDNPWPYDEWALMLGLSGLLAHC